LTPIHIPSIEEQEDRSLIRVRKQLVRDVARYKSRIKAHLYFKGITVPEEFLHSKGYWKKSFKEWLAKKELATRVGSQALHQQLHTLYRLEEQLKETNQLIRKLGGSERFSEKMKLITSIPGIGVLSGMIILTEIGDINRFNSADQLNSFAGLIPNIYASGETEYVGEMTKRGNQHLRTTIIECSWWAIRKDPALTMAYEKLCGRMKSTKAIVRIARKLLSRIRHVLVNRQTYILGMAA
jgi:transposase